MVPRHSLLRRQLKRFFKDETCPSGLDEFLQAVDAAYREFDEDRLTLERSLDLSSRELLQANSEMRAVFQALPDLFFRLDREGKILDCRGGRGDDFWIRHDELIGKRFQDVPVAGTREILHKTVQELLATRKPVTVEFALPMKGEVAFYEARLLPVLEDQFIALVRNITDRVRSAEELRRQRTFLRQIVDLNPSFIFAKDRQGCFRLANQAVAEAYGRTVNEMPGLAEADLNPNRDEAERIRADDREVLDTGRYKLISEEKFTDAAGRTRWLQTIKRAIPSPDGEENLVLCVATDITARREAEERVRERASRVLRHQSALHELALMDAPDLASAFSRIVETSANVLQVQRVGLWLFNKDRTRIVRECSHERGKGTDRDAVTLEAADFPRYFAALECSRTIDASAACEDARTSEFTETYLKPLGITSMLDVPIRQHGRLVGIVCHEHVGRKREWTPEEQNFASSIADFVALALASANRQQLEDQLRESQKMEAIGQLAGGVAHDFNNLLTGVLGYASLLKRRASPGDEVHKAADVIEKSAKRAAMLTQQLLGFARRGKHQDVPVDLHDTVQGVIRLLGQTIDRRISIRKELRAENATVRGDPGQLEQAVLNLCLNARDAMSVRRREGEEPGCGEMTLSSRIVNASEDGDRLPEGAAPGEYLALSVSDTGCGIPDDIRDRIFEPFFTTKEKGKGTGMGLPMVYGIVKNHGGWIDVQSEIGKGATFTIHLPTAVERRKTPRVEEECEPVRGSGRILLVDDDEVVREVAADMLRSLGYRVDIASDGNEAVRYYRQHAGETDLILLDMIMPNMGGSECFAELQKIDPAVRVILLTGYGRDGAAQRVLDRGALGFVQKPYEVTRLSREVARALALPVPCQTCRD